jgi:acyl carrier protein phosphodiesterase
VLNEPVSPELWEALHVQRRYPPADPAYAEVSDGVPTSVLKTYYRDAYDRIRAIALEVTVIFYDAFRMPEWFDYVVEPDFTNVVVDTHQYFLTYPLSPDYKPDATLDDLVAHAREQVASVVREAVRHFPGHDRRVEPRHFLTPRSYRDRRGAAPILPHDRRDSGSGLGARRPLDVLGLQAPRRHPRLGRLGPR